MANEFLNAKEFANVFLMLLKNNLVMGRLVDGRFRDQATSTNGAKIFVKRPPRFLTKSGATLQEQDIVTGEIELAVDQYKNVHFGIEDLEGVQSWNDLMRSETVMSAASSMAHDIDLFLANKMKEFSSEVGVPGNVIGSPQEFNAVHTRLMNQSVPNSNLNAAIQFEDAEQIRGSLIGGDIQRINRDALERTRVPVLSEIDVYASQNLPSVTNGDRTTAGGTVDGASQNVNYKDVRSTNSQTLNITIGANETVSAGEVFTIDGVFAVNQRTQQVLPYLKQFTVLADATADGAGDVALTISPWIIVPGTGGATHADTNTAFATVSAAPADTATVTFAGDPEATRVVRAAFHRQAIAMISTRLMMPPSGEAAFQVDPQTGIGIRAWRFADPATGRFGWRLDTVYGATVTDQFLGSRVNGT